MRVLTVDSVPHNYGATVYRVCAYLCRLCLHWLSIPPYVCLEIYSAQENTLLEQDTRLELAPTAWKAAMLATTPILHKLDAYIAIRNPNSMLNKFAVCVFVNK